MTNRVLVTGIAGFTGSYLTRALRCRGHEVHGTCRPEHASDWEVDAHLHDVELTRLDDVRNLIADLRPQIVIHLAGISFAAHGDIEELYLSNVVATRHLLSELSENAATLSHVIVASSANVYGNQNVALLTEQTPVMPVNDYGVSKVAAELIGSIYNSRLPITIVRPFNYTGVGQSCSFLIPKIVQHFKDRKDVIELGNVNVERDFSDVRDVAEIYASLVGIQDAIGTTLNICSGVATSLQQVINLCAEITNHKIAVRVNPDFVRQNEVASLRGSKDQLDQLIGKTNRIPLKTTLRWMLEN